MVRVNVVRVYGVVCLCLAYYFIQDPSSVYLANLHGFVNKYDSYRTKDTESMKNAHVQLQT